MNADLTSINPDTFKLGAESYEQGKGSKTQNYWLIACSRDTSEFLTTSLKTNSIKIIKKILLKHTIFSTKSAFCCNLASKSMLYLWQKVQSLYLNE